MELFYRLDYTGLSSQKVKNRETYFSTGTGYYMVHKVLGEKRFNSSMIHRLQFKKKMERNSNVR